MIGRCRPSTSSLSSFNNLKYKIPLKIKLIRYLQSTIFVDFIFFIYFYKGKLRAEKRPNVQKIPNQSLFTQELVHKGFKKSVDQWWKMARVAHSNPQNHKEREIDYLDAQRHEPSVNCKKATLRIIHRFHLLDVTFSSIGAIQVCPSNHIREKTSKTNSLTYHLATVPKGQQKN